MVVSTFNNVHLKVHKTNNRRNEELRERNETFRKKEFQIHAIEALELANVFHN
jgi:hypothetical protein